MKFLFLTVFILSAFAQSTEPKPEPKITIEQQADWLQARGELADAKLAMATAEAKYNAITSSLQAVCPLLLNPKGRPECAPPKATK